MNLPHDARGVVILNATIYDSFAQSIFYYRMMNLHYLRSHESAPMMQGESVILNASIYDSFAWSIFYYRMMHD